MDKNTLKVFQVLGSREMQIRATLRFHLLPVRLAKIKRTKDNKCWEDVGTGNAHSLLVGVQTCATTMDSRVENFQKANNKSTI